MRQPFLVGGSVVRVDRHKYLLGHPSWRIIAVERLEDSVDQPTRCEFLHLVEHETLAAHHTTLAHEEHLNGSFQVIVGKTNDVDVLTALADHLLLLARPPHRRQPVAHTRRPLVLQQLRRIGHLGLEPADDLVGVPIEEVAQLLHELAVRHLVDLAHARSAAFLDVKQQTRTTETLMFIELAGAARTNGETAHQQVERLANRVRMCVGAEVSSALALVTAHYQRSRKLLVDRDRKERVALVVAETHVEARVVLFDEAVLEHQSLDLVAYLDPFHRRCGGHHLRRARVQVARILEVVRQSLTQAGRLTHIDDAPVLVLELVRTGGLGNRSGRRAGNHAASLRSTTGWRG